MHNEVHNPECIIVGVSHFYYFPHIKIYLVSSLKVIYLAGKTNESVGAEIRKIISVQRQEKYKKMSKTLLWDLPNSNSTGERAYLSWQTLEKFSFLSELYVFCCKRTAFITFHMISSVNASTTGDKKDCAAENIFL